jgi:hypothetical protein
MIRCCFISFHSSMDVVHHVVCVYWFRPSSVASETTHNDDKTQQCLGLEASGRLPPTCVCVDDQQCASMARGPNISCYRLMLRTRLPELPLLWSTKSSLRLFWIEVLPVLFVATMTFKLSSKVLGRRGEVAPPSTVGWW